MWAWGTTPQYGTHVSATAIRADAATFSGFTEVNATCGDVEVAGPFLMEGPLGALNVTSGSLTAHSIIAYEGAQMDVGWDVICATNLYTQSASSYMVSGRQRPMLVTHHDLWCEDGQFVGGFEVGGEPSKHL